MAYTSRDKKRDYYDAYKCIREGQKVKRSGRKDGSIKTIPTVLCPDVPERDVLKSCMNALKRLGLVHNRNNVGAGAINGRDGEHSYFSYGMKSAGDIVGLFKSGIHFEVEAKRGRGGTLSYAQQKRMQQIRESNGVYIVAHSAEEMLVQMENYL